MLLRARRGRPKAGPKFAHGRRPQADTYTWPIWPRQVPGTRRGCRGPVPAANWPARPQIARSRRIGRVPHDTSRKAAAGARHETWPLRPGPRAIEVALEAAAE